MKDKRNQIIVLVLSVLLAWSFRSHIIKRPSFILKLSGYDSNTKNNLEKFTVDLWDYKKKELLYTDNVKFHLISNLPFNRYLALISTNEGYDKNIRYLWIDSRLKTCKKNCEFVAEEGIETKCEQSNEKTNWFNCHLYYPNGYQEFSYNYSDEEDYLEIKNELICDDCPYIKYIPDIHLDPLKSVYSIKIKDYFYNIDETQSIKIRATLDGEVSENVKTIDEAYIYLKYDAALNEGLHQLEINVKNEKEKAYSRRGKIFIHHPQNIKKQIAMVFNAKIQAINSETRNNLDKLSLEIDDPANGWIFYKEQQKVFHFVSSLPTNKLLTIQYKSCEYQNDQKSIFIDSRLIDCGEKCNYISSDGIESTCQLSDRRNSIYDCYVNLGDKKTEFQFSNKNKQYDVKIINEMKKDDSPYFKDIPDIHLDPVNSVYSFNITDYYCNKECGKPIKIILHFFERIDFFLDEASNGGYFNIENHDRMTIVYDPKYKDGTYVNYELEIIDEEGKSHKTNFNVIYHRSNQK